MVTIRLMLPSEWALHREVRLQSLLESPHAFGSTYASEAKRSDDEWQNIIQIALALGNNHIFLAEADAVICGLVWCKLRYFKCGSIQNIGAQALGNNCSRLRLSVPVSTVLVLFD